MSLTEMYHLSAIRIVKRNMAGTKITQAQAGVQF
jgi:hypothetical protein